MFDPKSDYALNKMAPDAIVYKDAAGDMTRLTQADFPSLEEFRGRIVRTLKNHPYFTVERGGELLLRVPVLVLFFLAAAGLAYCALTLGRMLRYPNQGGRFYAYS